MLTPNNNATNEEKNTKVLDRKMKEVGSVKTGSTLCTAMTEDTLMDIHEATNPTKKRTNTNTRQRELNKHGMLPNMAKRMRIWLDKNSSAMIVLEHWQCCIELHMMTVWKLHFKCTQRSNSESVEGMHHCKFTKEQHNQRNSHQNDS